MKVVCFIVLTALVFAPAFLQGSPLLVQPIFDQGMELFMRQDYSGSSFYLGQVVDMQPNFYQARHYFVLSLIYEGRTNKALEHLGFLRKMFPSDTVYSSLENNLRRDLMPKDVKKEYEITLDLDNVLPENRSNKPKPIKKQKTEEKMPPDYLKAANLIDEEKYDEAEAILEQLLKTKKGKDKGMAYSLLGIVNFNRGKYAVAVEYYTKGFGLGINDFESNFMAASAYMNMQMPDEALKYFERALKVNDEDVFARIYMADIYSKKSKYTEAEKVYKDILQKDPQVADAEIGLANIRLEQGFVEDAVNLVNRILAKHPENAKARFLKAKALLESKLYSEAVQEAEYAYTENPANVEYRIFTALVKVRDFQIPAAIEELNEILKQYPSNVYALGVMAEASIISGKIEEGKQYLTLAEGYEKVPRTSLLMGLAEVSERNYAEAKKHYEEYCKRSGNNPASLLEYAKFSELTESKDIVVALYRKVIELFPNTPYASEAEKGIAEFQSSSVGANYSPINKVIPNL